MQNATNVARYRSPWEEADLPPGFNREGNGHVMFWIDGDGSPGFTASHELHRAGYNVHGNADAMFRDPDYDRIHVSTGRRRLVIFSNHTFHPDWRTHIQRAKEEFGYVPLPAGDIVPVRKVITDQLLEDLHFDHATLLHVPIAGGLFGIARHSHSMRREVDAKSVQRFSTTQWHPYGACIMAVPPG